MIDKIKAIKSKFNGRLLFYFCDDKLYVVINDCRNMFEHSIFSKIDLEKDKEAISYV